MGLLKKFKNIFVEEYEDEEEEVVQMPSSFEARIPTRTESKIDDHKPINLEKNKVDTKPAVESVQRPVVRETPRPIVRESAPVHVDEEKIKIEPVQPKKEEKFVFPVYFDDNDFNEIEKKVTPTPKPTPKVEPVKKEVKTEVKEVKKESAYKEAFNNKKANLNEEKKIFKPTPIISPVYGILDKNYYKEDIVVTTSSRDFAASNRNMTIDDVRNKAYGTLEDDLTDNLIPIHDEENLEKNDENSDSDGAIFNENDFASAVEEDMKRDIAKDGLKADIEALLNNEEFTSAINFRKTKIEEIEGPEEKDKEKSISISISKDKSDDNKQIEEVEQVSSDEENDDEEVILSQEEFEAKQKKEKKEKKNESKKVEKNKEENEKVEKDEENTKSEVEDADKSLIADIMALAAGGRNKVKDNMNKEEKNDNDIDDDVKISMGDNDDLELPDNITGDEIDDAYEDVSDLNDSDLFNLIDSMYDKEDK